MWLFGYESITPTSNASELTYIVLIFQQYICRGIRILKVQFCVLEVSVTDTYPKMDFHCFHSYLPFQSNKIMLYSINYVCSSALTTQICFNEPQCVNII